MDEHQDPGKILKKLERDFEEFDKKRLEDARRISESVIPSIKKDLGDDSLEITVEHQNVAGTITGSNSFSLSCTRFLPDLFGNKPTYDYILGLAQHEKIHLDKEFPDVVMKEVMVDMAAAERYGPYALFSYHSKNVLEGDFTSPWVYMLGSLVNLKPLFAHESQKGFVENQLRRNYPMILDDMLQIINLDLSKIPENRVYVSRKLGNLPITSKTQEEMEKLFSEFITGLHVTREHIEHEKYGVSYPFSHIRKFPQEYISNYKKLENTLVLK